jgi:4-diphosphocytidyl-2-C-methyl-D-erythritol kinase
MIIKAPAKINFGLWIGQRQSNGYHLVSSIFLPVNLFDTLTVELNDSGRIAFTCDDPSLPADSENLCWKAAELFLCETNSDAGVNITLEKIIPSGAGLGGGSSDAAAVLMAINRQLFGEMTDERLYNMSVKLGADVPFFLYRRPCSASGTGVLLNPVEFPHDPSVVLVVPDFKIGTKEAYDSFDHANNISPEINYAGLLSSMCGLENARETVRNDFEPAIFSLYAELHTIRDSMYDLGAVYASMTGSGSVIYGFFDKPEEARDAKILFEKSYQTYLVEIIKDIAEDNNKDFELK